MSNLARRLRSIVVTCVARSNGWAAVSGVFTSMTWMVGAWVMMLFKPMTCEVMASLRGACQPWGACAKLTRHIQAREGQMTGLVRLLSIALLVVAPVVAVAGPAEDANAVIDRWSATYSANDRDALVGLYTPDAILLGTTSPIVSKG